MKSGKRQITEGIELPSQERTKTHGEKENCKYLGTMETETMKQTQPRENVCKEYLSRTLILLETKLKTKKKNKKKRTFREMDFTVEILKIKESKKKSE